MPGQLRRHPGEGGDYEIFTQMHMRDNTTPLA